MKLLLIYTNISINNISNDIYDILTNKDLDTINKLYFKSERNYIYYLFIDKNSFINLELKLDINSIIGILKKYKPAILSLNNYLKIYHRSLIHYIFPFPENYQIEMHRLIHILEAPLNKYKYLTTLLPNVVDNSNIEKYVKLYNWVEQLKRKNVDETKEYEIMEEDIEKINFLNTFNIYNYFDIDNKFFKNKVIKFHKNNKEIYGQCGTYHFLHDFRNANRNAIINHLIKKYNYRTYLEIGTYNCYHFNDVIIDNKFGVDPSPKLDDPIYKRWSDRIIIATSEEFYANLANDKKFDIIFIDGCLLEDNVFNDVEKSLEHITDNGTVILHDCNPPHEFLQRDDYLQRYNKDRMIMWNNRLYTDRHWNGKVWKVIIKLRMTRKDLYVTVVDTDWGVGIIRKGEAVKWNLNMQEEEMYNYKNLVKYRKYMLNLISVEKFLEIFTN